MKKLHVPPLSEEWVLKLELSLFRQLLPGKSVYGIDGGSGRDFRDEHH